MQDGLGDVQSMLVLGGGSDIAQATLRRLVRRRCSRIVLAVRTPEAVADAAAELTAAGAEVVVVRYDASDHDAHRAVLAQATDAIGDIDAVCVAFGLLGPAFDADISDEDALAVMAVNYQGAALAMLAASATLREQGHGTIVLLSSVAGRRVRRPNALYGSAKAGIDQFALALDHELQGTGVRVMVVRPGFVHTKMTEHLPPGPMATTPEAVASDIERGLQRHQRVVWSPPALRFAFAGLANLPEPLWRRLADR